MKKIILILTVFFTSLAMSCSNNNKFKENNIIAQKETKTTSKIKGLSLNKGKKWLVNLETYQGMTNIRTLIKKFNGSSLQAYHILGEKSDEQTNFIISNCSMKGEAHNQLHFILLPILDNKKNLTQAESIKAAKIDFLHLSENIETFFNFFIYFSDEKL